MSTTQQNSNQESNSADGSQDDLYAAWMTGYSYQACRSMYYGIDDLEKVENGETQQVTLLRWLNTYRTLVKQWGVIDKTKLLADLGKIQQNILEHPKSLDKRKENPKVEVFDDYFQEIMGEARASVRLAEYAMTFAANANKLVYAKGEDKALVKELKENLSKLRSVLNSGVYLVIENDITAEAKEHQGTKKMEVITRQWKDLLLGLTSVQQLLSKKGKTVFHIAVVAFAIGLALVAGGIIYGALWVISHGLGLNLSNLLTISNLQSVLTLLGTAGLTFSLLATKAWSGLKNFESLSSVWLLKFYGFRVHDEQDTS